MAKRAPLQHGDINTVQGPMGWQSVRYSDKLPQLGWHGFGFFKTQAEAQAVAESATFDGVRWVKA